MAATEVLPFNLPKSESLFPDGPGTAPRPPRSHLPLGARKAGMFLEILSICLRVPLVALSLLLFPRGLSSNRDKFGFTTLGLGTVSPHPDWTYRHAFFMRLIQAFTRVGVGYGLQFVAFDEAGVIPPADPKGRATPVLIQPLDDEDDLKGRMGGHFKSAALTKSPVPGWWYGDKQAGPHHAEKGEKVLMHLHGGGYWQGSGGPECHSMGMSMRLIEALKERGAANDPSLPHRIFGPSYRLSWQGGRFPAILADALASWRYLTVELGFEPENITVLGDSAGAHLALALTRYLLDEKPFEAVGKGGAPCGLVLYSPWIDISGSFAIPAGNSYHTMTKYDILDAARLSNARTLLMHGLPEETVCDPYISPVNLFTEPAEDLFAGFPRTIVFAASLECLIDEIHAFAEQYSHGEVKAKDLRSASEAAAAELAGRKEPKTPPAPLVNRTSDSNLTYYERPVSCHDYGAIPFLHDAESEDDARIVVKWLLRE